MKWTEEQEYQLERLYIIGYMHKEIAEIMGLEKDQISGKVEGLGLVKFNPYLLPVEKCSGIRGNV